MECVLFFTIVEIGIPISSAGLILYVSTNLIFGCILSVQISHIKKVARSTFPFDLTVDLTQLTGKQYLRIVFFIMQPPFSYGRFRMYLFRIFFLFSCIF